MDFSQVVNPPVHVCEKCRRPILIYGRMIPCKHVFCLQCAQSQLQAPSSSTPQTCSRCGDKVVRVEEAGIGSIWMCSHGGTRYTAQFCNLEQI